MMKFLQALITGGWQKTGGGYTLLIDDLEIVLEPLIHEQFYLAIYKKGELQITKIPLKVGN